LGPNFSSISNSAFVSVSVVSGVLILSLKFSVGLSGLDTSVSISYFFLRSSIVSNSAFFASFESFSFLAVLIILSFTSSITVCSDTPLDLASS
jgi:hypothetical protein